MKREGKQVGRQICTHTHTHTEGIACGRHNTDLNSRYQCNKAIDITFLSFSLLVAFHIVSLELN